MLTGVAVLAVKMKRAAARERLFEWNAFSAVEARSASARMSAAFDVHSGHQLLQQLDRPSIDRRLEKKNRGFPTNLLTISRLCSLETSDKYG